MPFSRPTLEQLQLRAAADIESRLPGADSQLRRSFLGVLSRTFNGALDGVYGFAAFIFLQVFPDTAETEFLNRWSGIWGIARKPAWPASGNITFTGTNGVVIASGSTLQRGDGAEFETTAEVTIADGTATAPVQASLAGVDGNADQGVTLNLVSPISGVQSAATVAVGGLALGSDQEADAPLRARLLSRIQQPPHGGARHDYLAWALDAEAHGVAVTRAWVYPQELGAGTVTVRFVMDDEDDIIPGSTPVAAVQAWIDALRPVTAAVTVVAPVPVELDLSISISPDTTAVREAIAAELADLLRREATPGGTILISHIREAVSIAAGEADHDVTVPAANATHSTGEVAVLGTITWSSL